MATETSTAWMLETREDGSLVHPDLCWQQETECACGVDTWCAACTNDAREDIHAAGCVCGGSGVIKEEAGLVVPCGFEHSEMPIRHSIGSTTACTGFILCPEELIVPRGLEYMRRNGGTYEMRHYAEDYGYDDAPAGILIRYLPNDDIPTIRVVGHPNESTAILAALEEALNAD